MKKRGIILKLFGVTLLFFFVFLCVFMGAQTLFFKEFYLREKTTQLEKNMEKFSAEYTKKIMDEKSITKEINRFADQNNAQLAILDKNGTMKFSPSYGFTLITKENKTYHVGLDNIAYLEGFRDLNLAVGADVAVTGYFDETVGKARILKSIKSGMAKWENSNGQLFSQAVTIRSVEVSPADIVVISGTENGKTAKPLKIENGGTINLSIQDVTLTENAKKNSIKSNPTISPNNNDKKADAVKDTMTMTAVMSTSALSKEKTLSGRIVGLELPARMEEVMSYNGSILWSAVDYWNGLVALNKVKLQPEKMFSFHYQSPLNGLDNLILVRPIYKGKDVQELVIAVSSLQPVGEAVSAMKSYYALAFFIALLLISGLALLYSKMLTKPLLDMNRVALKMADLDFSETVSVRSEDELGSLAGSLNRLSGNLGTALTDLKAANEQLLLDIEKEKSLELMRKDFVASVSHELKTPLGIIRGFAEGIKDNIAENKKEHYLEVILEEIGKMDEMVLELLDLAKLESKSYTLNMDSFGIVERMADLRNRFLKQLEEKQISYLQSYGNQEIYVLGDSGRIDQVLANILNNGIRHTPAGGTIRVGIETSGEEVLIYLENSGPKIPAEELEKVWEKFYRTEKSRNRNTGGTGLGLSITKNILELHESRYGVINTAFGVKFYFTLKREILQ